MYFFNLSTTEFSFRKKSIFLLQYVIKTKAKPAHIKSNHMDAFYATRIVALCTDHVECSLALRKDMSPHFYFCDWLLIIISITFYII